MWKCPNCETVNNGDKCVVCGEEYTKIKHVQQTYTNTEKNYNYQYTQIQKYSNSKLIIVLYVILALVVISVLLFFGNKYVSRKRTIEFENKLVLAQQFINQNNYGEALSILKDEKNTYDKYNESFEAVYTEGYVYMQLEDYSAAISCYEKALDIEESKECFLNLAVSYAKLGDYSRSEEILNKLSYDVDVKNYVQAEILIAQDKCDYAVACLETVISTTDDEELSKRAYITLASLYKDNRHKDKDNFYYLNKQIETMEAAVRNLKIEDDLTLTEMMAEAYFTGKKYDLAIQKFKRLLELGYDRDYIYINIAIIYQQINELDNAEKVLIQMKEKYPDNYKCYMQLAFIYIDMESQKSQENRDYTRAVDNYNLALKYCSSNNKDELVQLEKLIQELENKGWI